MQYELETYIKLRMESISGWWKIHSIGADQIVDAAFCLRVRNLERIVLVLNNGGLMPQSEFEHFRQELKKLEEKLSSSKNVSRGEWKCKRSDKV